jgi:hypothetical protein
MKRIALRPIALIAAMMWNAFCAWDAAATSVLPLSLTQIAAGAEHIAHVRCIGNAVVPDTAVGIVTVTTFVVLDRAKGAGDTTFTLRQAGGTLDGLTVRYHAPTFRADEEYVLFVPASSKLGLASPVGLAQGAFSVVRGPAGKTVGNGRDFGELLAGVNPARLPPGIASRLALSPAERRRMDLTDFMALVRAGGAVR